MGKNIAEGEVQALVVNYELHDLEDDPPFRQYIGSDAKGVDVLAENGQIIDVQIHVRGTASRGAFGAELPFGLTPGMSQADVHALLGTPDKCDSMDSQYVLNELNAKLSVVFNSSGVLGYLSIALQKY